MRDYLYSIISAAVACQMVILFSRGGDGTRRYIKIITSLVVLFTLAAPVIHGVKNADGLFQIVSDFFGSVSNGELDSTDADAGALEQVAYHIMKAVESEYGIDGDRIRITLVLDDTGGLSEVQLYLSRTAYSDRERVREGICGEFDVPVYVFGEG